MVVLATMATIIASQAALTGSFSVAKQAVQLGFLPRVKIVHTSEMEGQVYVPIINWILCIGVAALVLIFQNSNRLGDIYGVAVTATFILNTILFVAVAVLYTVLSALGVFTSLQHTVSTITSECFLVRSDTRETSSTSSAFVMLPVVIGGTLKGLRAEG